MKYTSRWYRRIRSSLRKHQPRLMLAVDFCFGVFSFFSSRSFTERYTPSLGRRIFRGGSRWIGTFSKTFFRPAGIPDFRLLLSLDLHGEPMHLQFIKEGHPVHTVSSPILRPTILVVDDIPQNLSLMSDILDEYYSVKLATSGARAIMIVSKSPPDLILLDIMMPEMDGYEVCRTLKADPACKHIPVIFVTAMDSVDDERIGFELGAVDYITKPVSPPIVLARVRTQIALHQQAQQLIEWNRMLSTRVAEGVASIERLGKLRRFFSPAVAELLLSNDADELLVPRRREIVVLFLDLRGYTAFSETASPEAVIGALGEYHAAMGELIMRFGGTLERFTGDGMMIFFNDPIEIPDPAGTALAMAVEMQARFETLHADWESRGYALTMGIGIAKGLATIGAIGFDGRRDYGAIGRVTNLAARLCAEASGGQILVSSSVAEKVRNSEEIVSTLRSLGQFKLKGFSNDVEVFEACAPNPAA